MTNKRFFRLTSRTALAVGLLLGLGHRIVSADQGGSSTAQFLRLGQGARAEAMGGAFTAVADDPHAILWNPAGLAQINRRQFSLDHLQFIEKINSQFAAFVLPVDKLKGSFGASITYVDLGSIDRRDDTGALSDGDKDSAAHSVQLSYGQAIGDRFALGLGLKNFSQNLAGDSKSGMAADLGVLVSIVPSRFKLGASVVNLGPKIKTGTVDENLPTTYRVGGVFHVVPEQFSLSADVEKERDTDTTLHGGGEYTYMHKFVLRAGYQDNHEAKGGLSAGAGFIWHPNTEGSSDFFGNQDQKNTLSEGIAVRIDYGFVDYGDFDATHRIGFTLIF